MPIVSYKNIDGTMTLGASDLDVAAQVTSAAVVPSEKVKETDPKPVLSGDELAGSSSASLLFRLKGKFLQDGGAAGVVAFSWENAGDEVEFTLKPNDASSASVTGTVRIVPLQIGGDVSKTDPSESDFDWQIIGTPVPTWDA
jgi:hypothetical protein